MPAPRVIEQFANFSAPRARTVRRLIRCRAHYYPSVCVLPRLRCLCGEMDLHRSERRLYVGKQER